MGGRLGRFGRGSRMSALPSDPAMTELHPDVGFVPILLQNSFGIDQHKFSGPYVRRTNNDLRDYVIL